MTPTLRDLARLLETAGGGDHHPRARDTAQWLIEQSAAGTELHEELVAKSAEEPSPLELARVLCAVVSQESMPEALATAYWLISQSAAVRAHHDHLAQIATDAGKEIKDWNWMTVLDYEHTLNRLLEATDDWQDPSDVLDPTRFQGFDCQALYSLCCARIERSDGAARRQLEATRDKLRRPAELERLRPITRRFEPLQKWLSEVEDPETAVDSLEEMARLLRSTLESSSPD